MNTILISVPYVYPLCPLNFNHAKMFVIADIYARYSCSCIEDKDAELIFPIASHYSGNTAQSTASLIYDYYHNERSEKSIETINLYKSRYKTPVNIIRRFVDPNYLMSYYNEEIIWELQSLDVSCNYNDAYTTSDAYFEEFVKSLFRQYSLFGLLIMNENDELAINYDDNDWREETIELINNTNIKHDIHKKTILSALRNLSSKWECLRKTGYGVRYDENGWIIDPMFDSELFMVFDLFIYWKNRLKTNLTKPAIFFDALFRSLKTNQIMPTQEVDADEQKLLSCILNSLPCSVFVAEEHLKNWIGKKFFVEQKLLHPELRTKTYRILGMAMLDGKRMSASRGHAVFSRDLIKEYGGTVARLVLLMSGGNISKTFNYEKNLPQTAKSIIDNFSDYLIFLKSNYSCGTQDFDIEDYSHKINKLIEEGYIRQAIIELLVNIPSSNKNPSIKSKAKMQLLFKKYLNILIPSYAQSYF